MQGDAAVIEVLNEVLTNELTAINQYFVHAKMCANWGYERLAAHHHAESIEEMKHADAIMDRILLLDGMPNMQRLNPVRIGETVPEQHACDLQLEIEAVDTLRKGIAICLDKADHGTRELLEKILVDEENGIDWIEARLQIIKDIGVENYLAEQINKN
jgi:bacterioferritin